MTRGASLPGGWRGAPRVRGGCTTCMFLGTRCGTSLIRWDVAGVRRLTCFPCEGTSQHAAASSQPTPQGAAGTLGAAGTPEAGGTLGAVETARAGGDSKSCRHLDLWGH